MFFPLFNRNANGKQKRLHNQKKPAKTDIRNPTDYFLSNMTSESNDFKREEICIVQYDSRYVSQDSFYNQTDYWQVAANWNQAYSSKFEHKYMFISNPDKCFQNKTLLASAWCKVNAMKEACSYLPRHICKDIKVFLYLDSDAIIASNYSFDIILKFMIQDTKWDTLHQPIAFNQDGVGWACKYYMARGYDFCINTGSIIWFNTEPARQILARWWRSALDSYDTTSKNFRRFRTKWPWEQDRAYALFNHSRDTIMLLPNASAPHLPRGKYNWKWSPVLPWCFSHYPRAGCFIYHYCYQHNQKHRLLEKYREPSLRGYERVRVNVVRYLQKE